MVQAGCGGLCEYIKDRYRNYGAKEKAADEVAVRHVGLAMESAAPG